MDDDACTSPCLDPVQTGSSVVTSVAPRATNEPRVEAESVHEGCLCETHPVTVESSGAPVSAT